jgi:hypothetical protein
MDPLLGDGERRHPSDLEVRHAMTIFRVYSTAGIARRERHPAARGRGSALF